MSRRCGVCNIYLSPAVWSQHENGKKHQKLLLQCQRGKASKCIVVSNLPSNMNDEQLKFRLKSFKGVIKVEVNRQEGNTAVLMFKNAVFANNFASTRHFVSCHELTINRPLTLPPGAHNKHDAALEIDPKTRNQLLSQGDVEAQIHFIVDHFSLKEETVMQRLGICQMLQGVMRDFFPGCVVIPYGSCANGLGMSDSDLDLFIDLKVDFNPVDEKNQSRVISSLICYLESYKCQAKSFETFRFLEKVQSLNGRTVINVVKQIIRRYAVECVDLFCIPHARCPIVSFVHRSTRSCCDVSVQNGLAIHNTVLVRLFQQLDPRVRPLLFTIRYWAKRMQLVDSKKNRFSSYAITMLAVFYLQNCNPTVLPTVETLQQLTDSNAMCYGWKCHFCMEQEKIPKTANREPLDILLAGFFDYYTEVDLASKVLCLRTGRVMSQSQFQEYLKSNENMSDFKMSIFNVQDMFELNFNITRGVNAAGLEQWNSAVSQARSICSSGALWEKISANHAWGLVCLLSVDPRPSKSSEPRPAKRKRTAEVGQSKPDGDSAKVSPKHLVHVRKQSKKKKKAAATARGSNVGGPSTPFAKKRRTT